MNPSVSNRGVRLQINNRQKTLGIGVAGFFSGMAMSLSDISLFLVNPFVLMMKPAVASTASIDTGILILGVFETIIFFMIGWYLCKIKHYE